jgi:hypothetical protein
VHEGACFAWLAFALRRLHVNASSEHRSTSFTLRLYLARFSPYPSKLFHPFLFFIVASPFASDRFAFVGNVANLNKRKKTMNTLETLEAELKEAHDALLAITKGGIFGKPRLQACGRVIEAMTAILAFKRAKLATK